jgi:PmbA protein
VNGEDGDATLPPVGELKAAAHDALDDAAARGADRARVTASCTSEQRLVVANNELSLAACAQSRRIHVLVHRHQREGAAATNTLARTALRERVDDALALARFSPADDCLVMPDAAQAPPAAPLPFLWDEALANVSLDWLRGFTQAVQARLARDRRVSIDRLEVSAVRRWRGVFNTLGVEQAESATTLGWSVMGMASGDGAVGGFDYERRAVFHLDGALENALQRCDEFCERVVGNLRQARAPAYVGPVLLSPRAVQQLLVGTILYHCSGHSVADGKSRWAGKAGSPVASASLSVADQPHDGALAGATAFDRDGLPTQPRTLLASGILQSHLFDCYSARRVGRQSTASAGAPFGLACAAGPAALADMKNARPELLMVDRFSGNLDQLEGDFSGVAKSSRLYRNGADQGCVNGVLIAGNVFALLDRVLAVSSTVENVSGTMRIPWMLLDGVHVSGG